MYFRRSLLYKAGYLVLKIRIFHYLGIKSNYGSAQYLLQSIIWSLWVLCILFHSRTNNLKNLRKLDFSVQYYLWNTLSYLEGFVDLWSKVLGPQSMNHYIGMTEKEDTIKSFPVATIFDQWIKNTIIRWSDWWIQIPGACN